MTPDMIIFLSVVFLRLLVPLLIPRFPFPAIIACMIIDGVDQTIFQKYTTINLDGYQGYDKALDIYYLSIAYLSTFRNWNNQIAFRISQFLFYYRMIGDTLFELTHIRALLFIFPNTFEYFFIFYSFVALLWNTKKLSKKFLVGITAFIWIFIKLPQEYWIHIAQLDTTDFIKDKILHVPVESTFVQIINIYPLLVPILGIFIILVAIFIWIFAKKLPKPDHNLELSPIIMKIDFSKYFQIPGSFLKLLKLYKNNLIEKIVLVGLISIIFAQIFPSLRGANLQIMTGITIVIFVNTVLSYVMISSEKVISSVFIKFLPMFIINLLSVYVYAYIVSTSANSLNFFLILFFAYIITLLTVFYDRFRPYYISRIS